MRVMSKQLSKVSTVHGDDCNRDTTNAVAEHGVSAAMNVGIFSNTSFACDSKCAPCWISI